MGRPKCYCDQCTGKEPMHGFHVFEPQPKVAVSEGGRIYGKASHCPKCGEKMDGYAAVSNIDSAPKSGDVSICVYCLSVLEFTENLVLKVIDLDSLPSDISHQLKRTILGIKYFKERKGGL